MGRGILAVVLFLSTAQGVFAGLLPSSFCDSTPVASSKVFDFLKTNFQTEFPDLKPEELHIVPEAMVLNYFEWAARQRLAALEVFTDDLFRRSDCVLAIPGRTMIKLGRAYELYLPSPFEGVDQDGRRFYVNYFFGGKRSLVLLYNMRRIVFDHPLYDGDTFELNGIIRESVPSFGLIQFQGISIYKLGGLLKYRIDSIQMIPGRKVMVTAEGHTQEQNLYSITKRSSGSQRERKAASLVPAFSGQRPMAVFIVQP